MEKIKRPESNPSELVRALRKEKINISELQVKRFFEKHGLEKKRRLRSNLLIARTIRPDSG